MGVEKRRKAAAAVRIAQAEHVEGRSNALSAWPLFIPYSLYLSPAAFAARVRVRREGGVCAL